LTDYDANRDLFRHVAELYKKTGSLTETAGCTGISYAKVRKILITEGEYETAFSRQVAQLKNDGLSIGQIAEKLECSKKRVNAFLPYEKGVYNAPEPSTDARKSSVYRQRIQTAKERISEKKSTVNDQTKQIQEGENNMSTTRNKPAPQKNDIYPVHIHLALRPVRELDKKEAGILHRFAGAEANGHLTRDILVPSDMPLHNLHYVIQRLYGWLGYHWWMFRLDDEDYTRLTGGTFRGWYDLVGSVFLGFLPDDNRRMWWDDDYGESSGSLNTWLKKKYTGPYRFLETIEDFPECRRRVSEFLDRRPFLTVTRDDSDGGIVTPVLDLKLKDMYNVNIIFEDGFDYLLTGLRLDSVLAQPGAEPASLDQVRQAIHEYTHDYIPKDRNPSIPPIAKKLVYEYDYGDRWMVDITRGTNRQIKDVPADALNAAKEKVAAKHTAVCIAKHGINVVEDVGGVPGFVDFVDQVFNKDFDTSDADMSTQELLEWAQSLGWSKRKVSPENSL